MNVEEYVQSLQFSEAEKNRYRRDISAFLAILSEYGRNWPEESDYQKFKELKASTDKNPRTTEDRIRRVRRYFEAQKGEAQMTLPETETPAVIPLLPEPAIEQQPQQPEPEAPVTVEEEENKSTRMGAPRKSPEGRDQKLTIYITASLKNDVKDLARIEGTTTPDYIFRLIEREAQTRADDLNLIRKMRRSNP